MKKPRHSAILSIIEEKNISTQEDLLNELLAMGYKVTQATVSRDIKELKLVKVHVSSGQYKYICVNQDKEDNAEKYLSIIRHSVIGVDRVENIAVVKCFSGMAMATCAALDGMYNDKGIAGTIAGDDTIFVLCRTAEIANDFKNEVESAFSN